MDYEAFGAFLARLVGDLNVKSGEGWTLLVEGPRDRRALVKLGFTGPVGTISLFARKGIRSLAGSRKVVILTDLDREGAVLASRFIKTLSHDGIEVSLSERRRLKAESRGVFLHIENLQRFAGPDASRWSLEGSDTPRLTGVTERD